MKFSENNFSVEAPSPDSFSAKFAIALQKQKPMSAHLLSDVVSELRAEFLELFRQGYLPHLSEVCELLGTKQIDVFEDEYYSLETNDMLWFQTFGNHVFEVFTAEYIDALSDHLLSRAYELGCDAKNPCVVLEVGAGNGRLSHALEQSLDKKSAGVFRLIPTDCGEWGIPSVIPVEKCDYVQALKKFQPHIVISSWMIPDQDWTVHFRACKSVCEYVVIGVPHLCGDVQQTWGLGSPLDCKYYSDGFAKVELTDVSRLQVSSIDREMYRYSKTVVFQRLSAV